MEQGETVEQAVIREIEEELGLRVVVKKRVAEVWFQANRQEYFLVQRLGGEFGTGTGEEYGNPPPGNLHGTYHPVWMQLSELQGQPVLPREMAERVARFAAHG